MFCLPLLHLAFTLQAYFNKLKAEQGCPEFHLTSIAQETAQCRAANRGDLAAGKPQPQRGTAMANPSSAHTPCACSAWQGGSSPAPLSFSAATDPGWEASPWHSWVKEAWDGHNLCCPRGACSALSS